MKKYLKRCLLALCIIAVLLGICGCNYEFKSVRFQDFFDYEYDLLTIAQDALALYRTQNQDERVFIWVGSDHGNYGSNSNYETFPVDEKLRKNMMDFSTNDATYHFEYIVIGDTFVTFTGEGIAYAIVYSEDNIRPLGSFKYHADDGVMINKITDHWFEIRVDGWL